jgi:hypothetical protein
LANIRAIQRYPGDDRLDRAFEYRRRYVMPARAGSPENAVAAEQVFKGSRLRLSQFSLRRDLSPPTTGSCVERARSA